MLPLACSAAPDPSPFIFILVPLLLLLASFPLPSVAETENCYTPDGRDRNLVLDSGRAYQPCPLPPGKQQEHKMCCRWNQNASPDTCLYDDIEMYGLCISASKEIWRESCTDPTWESEGCLKLCHEGFGKVWKGTDTAFDMAADDIKITRCGDGSLCCGERDSEMATECCRKQEGVWIVDGKVMDKDPKKAAEPSGTSTSSASISPSRTSSSTEEGSTSNSSTDTGVIVGAVVGGVIGVAVVGVIVWFLVKRRRRRARMESEGGYQGGEVVPEESVKYAQHLSQEMPSSAEVAEIPGSEAPVSKSRENREIHELD